MQLNTCYVFRKCVFGEYQLDDWLIDVCLDSTNKNIIAATAHSTIYQIKLQANCDDCSNKLPVSRKLPKDLLSNSSECAEKCLLYSGKLVVKGGFLDCVLLGGTVFSQLMIWGPWGNKNEYNQILPFHLLSGHKV